MQRDCSRVQDERALIDRKPKLALCCNKCLHLSSFYIKI